MEEEETRDGQNESKTEKFTESKNLPSTYTQTHITKPEHELEKFLEENGKHIKYLLSQVWHPEKIMLLVSVVAAINR
jgi:hypothetical protein